MQAANFQKIIDFMKAHTERGVYIVLEGKEVAVVAVSECSLTTVQLAPQRVSGGRGVFFVTFNDLYNCRNALRHDGGAMVVLSRSEQPLIPGCASLKLQVSDWFEAHLGHIKKDLPVPKKSGRVMDVALMKETAHSLRPLSFGNGYAHIISKTIRVNLTEPGFGARYVCKIIY
jgi:hypothetical protein